MGGYYEGFNRGVLNDDDYIYGVIKAMIRFNVSFDFVNSIFESTFLLGLGNLSNMLGLDAQSSLGS